MLQGPGPRWGEGGSTVSHCHPRPLPQARSWSPTACFSSFLLLGTFELRNREAWLCLGCLRGWKHPITCAESSQEEGQSCSEVRLVDAQPRPCHVHGKPRSPHSGSIGHRVTLLSCPLPQTPTPQTAQKLLFPLCLQVSPEKHSSLIHAGEPLTSG